MRRAPLQFAAVDLSASRCGQAVAKSAWVRPAYHLTMHCLWSIGWHRGQTPHRIKEQIVRDYAQRYGLRVLVETGTYMGDMVCALRRDFSELHTVELDSLLYEKARRRLARYPHVHVYRGDSGRVLPDILARLSEPALFWLDGHFSGGTTAKGEQATPIRAELGCLLATHQPHVILIDDARAFTGQDDYPSMDELTAWVGTVRDDLTLAVSDDVIRISPGPP
jgi:hypothetical protein